MVSSFAHGDLSSSPADADELLELLRDRTVRGMEHLLARADETRRRHVGDEVFLRGLVEIGNVCRRRCAYCGIAATMPDVVRYRMSCDEIFEVAQAARDDGYKTLVLQSGEDPALDVERLAELIGKLKVELDFAVTLSLGERSRPELERLRLAGADRYLLRIETADESLFARLHPPGPDEGVSRMRILAWLKELDYEVGSGVMVGLPGQSYEDLVRALALFRALDLDMLSVGPYVAHPETPLGKGGLSSPSPKGGQVPNTLAMSLKMLALARLCCPDTNIPATTALGSIDTDGYRAGLAAGANVLMPNLTPPAYRGHYGIYPGKVSLEDRPASAHRRAVESIEALGRHVGRGRGDSLRFHRRRVAGMA